MTWRAWIYLWSVLLVGAALAILAIPSFDPTTPEWLVFSVLLLSATAAQLFEAKYGRQSYYPHIVFFFAGVLLLPLWLFVPLIVIPHVVEWTKARLAKSDYLRAWYIQPFNIATHLIAGTVAHGLSTVLGSQLGYSLGPPLVSVVLIAVFIYVFINHLLIGLALLLARGVSLQTSGIFTIDSLLPDAIMACLGGIVAVLWPLSPGWVVLALSPLVLMYKALLIPQLQQEAQTDSKTGLLNARHFNQRCTTEFERAQRLSRPLSFIMADLDLLRNINNTYGHLAGDVVLTGIAQIIRATIRPDDLAGRFGGEEFAIVLPETEVHGALALAERLRQTIAAAEFTVATSPTPIQVTMSLGVACFPQDAATQADLLHAADIAVYQAKHQGRNRVVCIADVPQSVKLEIHSSIAPPTGTTVLTTVPGVPDNAKTTTEGPPAPSAPVANPIVTIGDAAEPSSPRAADSSPPAPAVSVHQPSSGAARSMSHPSQPRLFWMFVSSVIASAVGVALLGIAQQWAPNIALIGLFVLLALLAEWFPISVYERNMVSVSVAVAFAAALLIGIPGAISVSAAIVLAQSLKRRPRLYRAAFNWATHVLAGAVSVFMVRITDLPLQPSTLPLLALPIACAALLYYLVETGLIAASMSLSARTPIVSTWQNKFQWLAMHYLVLCGLGLFAAVAYTTIGMLGIGICALPLFLTRYTQKHYVERIKASMEAQQRLNIDLGQAHRDVVAANVAIQQLNDELFETLARFFDTRDPYVGSHAAAVGEYATALACELGFSGERLKEVRQAGFLHDIGKIGISEQILHKPGKLTDAEYERIKQHAILGAELLEKSRGLRNLAPFIRYHHERWDGQGYPEGLRGEAIPLEARILNVCESVEAMASDRPYHRGMALPKIIAEVKHCAGAQFDPMVTEAFLRVVEREGAQFIINSAHQMPRQHVHIEPVAGLCV